MTEKTSKQGSVAALLAERAKTLELSHEEVSRYSRHLIMPEVGAEGQKRLKAARVLCIGTGGLGSPLTLYLAAAGIGTLGLVDFDVVDETNLQRQIVHGQQNIGQRKVDSAKQTLQGINPMIDIQTFDTRLTSENAFELFENFDIIADGTDNFATRYLVNDACVLLGKPNVYGSIFRFEGLSTVFDANEGPCYRCLYPEPPPPGMVPSCAEGGVLGILPGVIGVIQAIEVIKLALGLGEPLIGRLLSFDAQGMRFKEFKLRKDEGCPICGTNRTITKLIDYEQFCGLQRGQAEPEAELPAIEEISPEALKQLMDSSDAPYVIDVREKHEYDIVNIGAKLIPLSEIEGRLAEIPKDQDIVVHCHHGMRSQKAIGVLMQAGFSRLKNLEGGIDQWALEVDPTLPRY